MIYEMRTYTLYPGKVKEFLRIVSESKHLRDKYSKPAGYWYTEIGSLDQVVSLWPYEDITHRMEIMQAVAQDPEWQKIVPRLSALRMKRENKILIPADFSALK